MHNPNRKPTHAALAAGALAAAALTGMTGCAGGSGIPSPAIPAAASTNAATGDTKAAAKTTAQNADNAAAGAEVRLGFRLLSELVKQSPDENRLVSPASVSFALALIANGTGGETRTGVMDALQLEGLGLDKLNDANATLRTALEAPKSGVEVTIANGLWANEGAAFDPGFVQRVQRSYRAETATLNFAQPEAMADINNWVKQKTNNKIEELVSAGDLANATSVLANAIYFKGKWATPFDTTATRDAPFTLPDGKQKTLPMMSRTGTFRALHSEQFEAVALPYGDGRFEMVALLPAAGTRLDTFVSGVDAKAWTTWMTEMRDTRLDLMFPRFRLSYEATLNRPLSDLGMAAAFGSGADFGPMGLAGSSLGVVKHKAVLEVNEEGTEAAAATGGVTVVSAPPRVAFDRPFLCAIRDTQTGALLFVGTVNDPE